MEIWKDIKGYEGYYQVSNLGRVKSLDRIVNYSNGGKRFCKGIVLNKNYDSKRYHIVRLSKRGTSKTSKVHQLVAIAFLNHTPSGNKLVVNHIDFNKTNNNLYNLEIVTNRENCNKNHLKSKSKYTGVSWNKLKSKWASRIYIKGKSKWIGYFKEEIEAHLAYQKELLIINKNKDE